MTETQLLQEVVDLLRARHPANEVMGIEEAAAYLDVGETFLRELIALYKIPHAVLKGKKSRGRIVLRRVDLDAFVASQLVHAPQDAQKQQDGRRMQFKVR
jgi:excisionase family DNA binding protein